MDVMHGVLAAVSVGLGVAVFLLWRALGGARARLDAAAQAGDDAQRLAERARADLEAAARDAERTRAELADARDRERESSGRVLKLSEDLAGLRERLESAEQVRQELVANEKRMSEAFEAIGSKTVRASQETLARILNDRLAAADEKAKVEHEQRRLAVEAMVRPIGETLLKTTERLTQLDERVKASGESADQLRDQTARLAKALSRPEIRGQYGEIQLKRVAELAGMTSYCDFCEQESSVDDNGRLLRPDMVVTLPNNRKIAVDAKTNIHAYLEAVNASDDGEREGHMERFARHVGEQAKKLGDKKYWSAFEGSPDFVVMFVPGDQFIDAALSRRPDLLDRAAQEGVILASPSTLIGLLRAVAVGWREHAVSEQARELIKLGGELHQRASVVFDHAEKLGRTLNQSVNGYNQMVGSMQGRLTPTLKKFEELGAKSGKELAELKPVDAEPRGLLASEE